MNVLMLHDIREFDEKFFPNRYKLPYFLQPWQFDKMLNNLQKKSKMFSLNEKFTIHNKYIFQEINLLTFDDGLKDHLSIARKLATQNIKACFFIPSGPITERKIIDSHKIQFLLAAVLPEKIIEYINKSFEENFNKSSTLLNQYYKSRWTNNIWTDEMIFITRVLREYNNYGWRRKLINDLFCKYVSKDYKSFSNDFYLSYEDVVEIKSLGHVIGGHGHYSYDLRFEDYDTINDEIHGMNIFLDGLMQSEKYYSYANGGYTDYVLMRLTENKYDYAFTTVPSKVEATDTPLKIPRIDPTKTNLIL
jgi:hypothetical protein